MNPQNLEAAQKAIPNQPRLVNLVSRRVRQLNSGQRPLIDVPPDTEALDIALMEIAEGKVTIATGTDGESESGAIALET